MMGVGGTSDAARAEITEEPSRLPTEIASVLAKIGTRLNRSGGELSLERMWTSAKEGIIMRTLSKNGTLGETLPEGPTTPVAITARRDAMREETFKIGKPKENYRVAFGFDAGSRAWFFWRAPLVTRNDCIDCSKISRSLPSFVP